MAGQIVRLENHSRLQHDASHHEFAPLRVRNSEDRHFTNCGMFVDDRFDLAGINIFATCDNHVFQAVKDVEIAVRILIADVSSAKHSVSKCESRVFWIVPVAPHDVGAPCDQFPVLPDFHFLSRFVLDSQINSWTRPPTRYEDETGKEVEVGQHGELVARGANVMRGYWNDPQDTALAFRNGMFRTGDIGY